VATVTWSFEELGLTDELDKLKEEYFALQSQHELLRAMVDEFRQKGDYGSETVKYLRDKEDFVWKKYMTVWDIKRYIDRLKRGYPFNVSIVVGMNMTRFGLTPEQSELFLEVHKKHFNAFEEGSEQQRKRSRANITNVNWSDKDDCLHVHYDDGQWWHYCKDGTWY
jgi:hypothetical protein